jgi:LacI family transcriptional regulator
MNKLSVKSNIASELKRRILDGEYAPGSMMPNQSQLTKEFKTSFSTITQALKEVKEHAGIELDENLIIIADGYESTIAYSAMKKYLTQYPTPPTAIIACRDYLAAGAWQALDEVGFTIGTDVSIIGFDNLSWPEGKNLTTFEEPASELGRIAAEILIKRITYGFTTIEKRELKAPLILRSSVGPCPQVDAEAISLKLYQSA